MFALAALLASLAGSLEAYYQKSGVPGHIWPESYGISLSILLISGVVIGGLRSMWGALWGAVLIVALCRRCWSALGWRTTPCWCSECCW